MLEQTELEKYDKQKMFQVYNEWPKIAQKCYNDNFKKISFKKSDHIIFAGMGGSGAICDVFSAILSKTGIHTEVIKGYDIPKTVDKETIVIITSVSGNTEETFNILSSASDLKCKIIAFSDGGKIEKFCKHRNLEHRKISMIHSPRASFPAFLFSIIKILEEFLPIDKKDVLDSIEKLQKQNNEISSNNLNNKNPAISLANWLSDVPLIYYPAGLQASAIRFKNSLQENAKMHAITEDVIEACHNGIVSWEKPSSIKPILIQGENDHFKTKERWKILKEFFDENNIEYKEIFSNNGSILSKLINLIYLLDYSTIYRAVLSGIDPTPVNPIDFVKKRL